MAYSVGSRVFIKMNGNKIVNNNEDFTETILVPIIGKNDDKYLIYLPEGYRLKGYWLATENDMEAYGFDKRWLKKPVMAVLDNKFDINTKAEDGMNCCKCDEFIIYAESNQSDGTFICWSCRSNPLRNYY